MANVFLLSAVSEDDPHSPYYAHDDLRRLRGSAEHDAFGVHALTEHPETADLIIFAERAHAAGPYLEMVRRHPLVKRYREKCFVCNSRYFGVPFLPGVYGCVRRKDHLFKQRLRSGHYLEVFEKDHLTFDPDVKDRPYLFSFIGSVDTWPAVRAPLAKLKHPRGLFVDTSQERSYVEDSEDEARKERYQQRYVETCHKSKFVLAPRGDAVGSMRLFESMKMGRAPVIIADQWVFPEGPPWNDFSITVPEKHIGEIPRLLEQHEGRAQAMGRRAREIWEQWFSREASFHRVVEWCLDMKAHRSVPESLLRIPVSVKLLDPFHLRRYARTRYHLAKRHKKVVL